jgi:predicted MPP superfamily phosphohydrolase
MPVRFYLALAVFHLGLAPVSGLLGYLAWRRTADRQTARDRLWLLWGGLAFFAAVVGLALLAIGVAFLPAVRVKPGSLLVRLLAQALFGEGLLLCGWLAIVVTRAGLWTRGALFAAAACGLLAVYWRAYHVEPFELLVRHHGVPLGAGGARTLRILHMSDVQASAIGPHEERAFREGLSQRPDLIAFTGDYIEERTGEPTSEAAVRDLKALLRRLAFHAPLGVFATEGDAGLGCREVFRGLPVRCLVDEGQRVELPGGGSLTIVGLSRSRSRERDPELLRRLIEAAPRADYRLVIGHSPDFVSALAGHVAVDLALAGHTHGGQVVLPLIGPPFTASRLPRRYAGDLHDYHGIPLHVSRGVGMERGMSPQIRFLCPPEICVLDVRYGRTRLAARD